jgi:hypothetical protein
MCTAPAALSVFLALSSFLSVFDAPLGGFDTRVAQATANRVVWVPENFRSVAELYRFLLPHAEVHGYPADSKMPDASIPGADDFVVIQRPLDAPAPAGAVGSRIHLTSRHTARQIWEMATGSVQKHLFSREWVVTAVSLPAR